MNFNLLGLSPATKIALSIVCLILLIVAGLSVNYFMTSVLINRVHRQEQIQIARSKADEQAAIKAAVAYSNRQWCDTLNLLTSRPVPRPADPAANPSREGQYLFYINLVQLGKHFGCR